MPEQHVKQSACDNRHKGMGMKFKVGWGVAIVIFSMMSYSIVAGHQALRQVDVHTAAEKPKLDEIRNSLNRIESAQIRMDARMDRFLGTGGE